MGVYLYHKLSHCLHYDSASPKPGKGRRATLNQCYDQRRQSGLKTWGRGYGFERESGTWVQIPGGYTGAIAPPRICQEGLTIAQAPKMMKCLPPLNSPTYFKKGFAPLVEHHKT